MLLLLLFLLFTCEKGASFTLYLLTLLLPVYRSDHSTSFSYLLLSTEIKQERHDAMKKTRKRKKKKMKEKKRERTRCLNC